MSSTMLRSVLQLAEDGPSSHRRQTNLSRPVQAIEMLIMTNSSSRGFRRACSLSGRPVWLVCGRGQQISIRASSRSRLFQLCKAPRRRQSARLCGRQMGRPHTSTNNHKRAHELWAAAREVGACYQQCPITRNKCRSGAGAKRAPHQTSFSAAIYWPLALLLVARQISARQRRLLERVAAAAACFVDRLDDVGAQFRNWQATTRAAKGRAKIVSRLAAKNQAGVHEAPPWSPIGAGPKATGDTSHLFSNETV